MKENKQNEVQVEVVREYPVVFGSFEKTILRASTVSRDSWVTSEKELAKGLRKDYEARTNTEKTASRKEIERIMKQAEKEGRVLKAALMKAVGNSDVNIFSKTVDRKGGKNGK